MVKKVEAAKPSKSATKPAASTAVAAPASTAVGAAIDFAADAGAGLEGADRDSYAIPFIGVLQPMSPAVVDGEIDGAKPGLFINTVSLALMENPMMIPCAFQRRWLRWTPRELGGGFKGEMTTAEVNALKEAGTVKELDGRLYYPESDGSVNPKKSDRLSDTRSHFVLIVDGPSAEVGIPAVFAVTSTGIKTSKNWLARIEASKIKNGAGLIVTAPSFSQVYQASTEKKTNDKGTWWVPLISPVGQVVNAQLYAQCKAFHAQINAGKVEMNHDSMARAEGGGDSEKF
jgi:hypothetical protein